MESDGGGSVVAGAGWFVSFPGAVVVVAQAFHGSGAGSVAAFGVEFEGDVGPGLGQ